MHDPMQVEEITPDYLSEVLRLHIGDLTLEVGQLTCSSLKPGFTSGLSGGLYRFHLEYKGKPRQNWPRTLILKANPADRALDEHVAALVCQQGLDFLVPALNGKRLNYRELMSYRTLPGRVTRAMPVVYHTVLDEERGRLWLFLEDLDGAELLDAWNDVSVWSQSQLEDVMQGLASFHSECWNDTKEWEGLSWVLPPIQRTWIDCFGQAISAASQIHPQILTEERIRLLNRVEKRLPKMLALLENQPRTLVHGDCSPRNACFGHRGSERELIQYDWALTGVSTPQHDLAKFLLFVLDPRTQMAQIRDLIDSYIAALPDALAAEIDREDFHMGFDLAALCSLTVFMIFLPWTTETDELGWLFQELEHRLRFLEIAAPTWLNTEPGIAPFQTIEIRS